MAAKATKKKNVTASRTKARSAAAKSAQSVKHASTAPFGYTQPEAQGSAQLFYLPSTEEVNKAAHQAQETMRSAAESMMKTSSEMFGQFFGNPSAASAPVESATTAAAEQAFAYGRDALSQFTQFAQGAGAPSGNAAIMRENVDAMLECANIYAALSKQLAAHSVAFANRSFNLKIELLKQWLACRTLNDLFDVSSSYSKSVMENIFTQTIAVSEVLFKGASSIADPINACVNENAERARKMMQE